MTTTRIGPLLSARELALLRAARDLCERYTDADEDANGPDDDSQARHAAAALARMICEVTNDR